LRVLDIATLYSAPMLAAMLGDLGADVIKLEPPAGDGLRQLGARVDGQSLVWAAVGRNKRCITLNLSKPAARPILERLLESADVLVENLPTRTLKRWDCTWEELHARHPRLVVVSVSAYGRSGPYAERPGNGTLAEAFAGLTGMTGEADGPPMLTSLPIGDVLTAISGTLGALAALYRRDARGGPGQRVDVSMYEPILQLLTNGITQLGSTGEVPRRSGSRIPGAVPRNVYQTRDGAWIALSAVTDGLVARLLGAMGRDDPESRERWGNLEGRRADEDGLDRAVADWVAGETRDQALATLVEAGIPAAAVNDLADLRADPHVQARGSIARVKDPHLGELELVAPLAQLSETPASIRNSGAEIGQHNREIYLDELGLSGSELEQLHSEGVI
jgi:crotonobetainyl-CoA:carnitine CoA-transferase CaiB-like acyl-CoA transferase